MITFLQGEKLMLTEANATRTDGLITVRLIVQLPTPCDEATIVGYFPGTIIYHTDPGSAQIFIKMGRKHGLENMYCAQVLGRNWMINHNIRDNYHKMVEIFINGCFARKIKIIEHTERLMSNIIDL
jgi:hypothetical protein